MKLHANSLTAQLYRWFYATSTMPESLCPYFWKMILAWVFLIPYTILSLPVILMDRKDPEKRSTGERAGIGFIIWFILFIVVCMLSWVGLFFVDPPKDSLYMNIIVTGFIGWAFSIGIGVAQLIKFLKHKWETRHIRYDEEGYRIWEPVKEKEPSIIKEFVKAKYNKYCPKIEWFHEKN